MDATEELHQPFALTAGEELTGVDDSPVAEHDFGLPPVTESFVLDVLAAVADMALRSKRRQADLDAAMRHAGIQGVPSWRLAALERLRIEGYVDRVVPLSDGGVLLSVTAPGLDRLGGIRSR